ncbi:5-methylcytosine rRNA methyltransferase NSUN4 [Anopheles ziemanni]|uniref:5-methylcytosine rRNA methyltransferase NSUN4 n=1 Tax=Anopheles coustani TaxID=139045 RepID=UPI00265884D8|nr:5-methylcytosine rRNA methyltransferase NSUN4 [Anopheles coustani]XP_058177949.1 5-methylcytosine rRNA methyltransferase NSUN4 [Anopheles ziemanni]
MLRTTNRCPLVLRRFRHSKSHWSEKQKKQFPKDRALANFDDFYGSVFGARWKSVRIALQCEHKYVALVNQFGDTEKTIELLQSDGAINLRDIYLARKDALANENQQLFTGGKVFKMGDTVEAFRASQQQSEADTIYRADPGSAPDTLASSSNSSSASPVDETEQAVDYKKSLDKTLKDDSEIDYQRLVDPAVGTAALHEFVPATKLKGMEDYVFESEHYKYYSNSTDFPLNIEMEDSFRIPETLHLYTYERANVSTFRSPRKCTTGVLSHFLFDGASCLPPLALDVQPGDRVLDACAAPGGKSLLLLQTLLPGTMVMNDLQESRCNRIRRLMRQYLYDFDDKGKQKRCFITQTDARNLQEYSMYDRVLVDVPCTNDRHSLMENDNNIFKPSRVKERLRLPELQAAILSNCLKLLRPGGTLVYSTCSLSPVQNDGVVHMALSNVFNDIGLTVTIKDLSLMVQPLADIFKFANPATLKYGQLVLPFLPANFGPMYICKMVRNE